MSSKIVRGTALAIGVLLIVGGVGAALDVASGVPREQTLSLVLTVVGIVFCAFGVGRFGAGSSAASRTLTATRIEIVDKDGKGRILLSAQDSEPAVKILGEGGDLLLRLGLTRSKPDLALWDAGGPEKSVRVRVCSLDDGTAGIGICDAEGRPRAFLTNLKDSSGLTLFNKEAKKRAELVATNSGSYVRLQDDKEVTRAELYTGATWNLDSMEESFLKAAGGDEAKRNIVPILIEQIRDRSGLTLHDATGTCRAEASVTREQQGDVSNVGGYFATHDSSGQVEWRAPAAQYAKVSQAE